MVCVLIVNSTAFVNEKITKLKITVTEGEGKTFKESFWLLTYALTYSNAGMDD